MDCSPSPFLDKPTQFYSNSSIVDADLRPCNLNIISELPFESALGWQKGLHEVGPKLGVIRLASWEIPENGGFNGICHPKKVRFPATFDYPMVLRDSVVVSPACGLQNITKPEISRHAKKESCKVWEERHHFLALTLLGILSCTP